jgi:hypothetical protein
LKKEKWTKNFKKSKSLVNIEVDAEVALAVLQYRAKFWVLA